MLENFAIFCIEQRKKVLLVVAALTLVLATFAARIDVKTVFEDLQPGTHPYIKVHEEFKKNFWWYKYYYFHDSVHKRRYIPDACS